MNWREINLKAVVLFASGRIEKTMESKSFGTQYTITKEDGEIRHVDIVTKKGHNNFTCDCHNCLTSSDKSNICEYKIASILRGQKDLFK